MGQRSASVAETRRRVLGAARALLRSDHGYRGFTVDAVAAEADVSRATVYYQFGSKAGLLEALCDALAEEGGIGETASALPRQDPEAGLAALVAGFGRFYAADRTVLRRLRALAVLDPDVGEVVLARDRRRWLLLRSLLGEGADEEQLRALHALTGFEAFDAVAGADRALADAVPAVTALALGELGRRRPPG
jgi:AcrR family transcriptional regulator